MYVFDCGTIRLENLDMFNIKPEESDVRELFVPCYLIRHDNGILFWDGGLPKTVVGTKPNENAQGPIMRYERWIIDQLADMDLAPADITYAAYSRLHFDHAGAANELVANTVLMQQAEWDKAFDAGNEFVESGLFDGLKTAKLKLIDGDLYHTRANRTLRRVPNFNYNAEQTLESMDKIDKLLVDTGATLWIEHDMELADTLKKAPAYYD